MGPGPLFAQFLFLRLGDALYMLLAFGLCKKRCSRSKKGTGTTKHIETPGVQMRSDALSNGMGKSLAAIPC